MNPLTLVKRIQNINSKEASLGISEDASWHAKYKDSAYVYVGGIPFDLTEGDLLAVFAQYGEIVDVNLVRDKGTGKSKGFAFVAYEDQRSTTLAVDNLNGAQVLGRTIRVDHVAKYKKKEEEDEEAEQQKREARGVCRAFQRGECTRGAGCKFSHNEQRAANTGWGAQDAKNSRWENDKFEGPTRGSGPAHRGMRDKDGYDRQKETSSRAEDTRSSRMKPDKKDEDYYGKRSFRYDSADDDRRNEQRSKYDSESYQRDDRRNEKRSKHDSESYQRDDRRNEKRSKHDSESYQRDDRRNEKRSKHDSESYQRDDRRNEKRSKHDLESYQREHQESDKRTSRDHRRKDEDHRVRSHRG